MTNYNAIDLAIMKRTYSNAKYNKRLRQVQKIVHFLDGATEPKTAGEIADAVYVDVHVVTHVLTRLLLLDLAKVVGFREIWYDVDANTKKRGEVRLYTLA